jgi:hypothetical protein
LIVVGMAILFTSAARAADGCEDAATASAVNHALVQIEASVDPCGDEVEISRVVRAFRRCAVRGYRICQDRRSERNFIEPGARTAGVPTTITWNPDLRTELERGCGGEPQRPVKRDPIASLLHEIVHAVQDCRGLDPTQHELEAVRIENIYRRAQGMCQRTRYGDERLPARMLIACAPGECSCTPIENELQFAEQQSPATSEILSEAAGDVAASPPRR